MLPNIVVSACTGALIFTLSRVRQLDSALIKVPDAVGLAVFTVVGARVAMDQNFSWIIAVIMGMTTGVAGGVLMDMLSGEIPLILRTEIYGTASMRGTALPVFRFKNKG